MIAQPSSRAFIGISTLLFVASSASTIAWCRSMSAMHDMPMPGGWNMSMMWMRMPGQTWPGSAMTFIAMWSVMMTAMMLPSLMPMLWRYRSVVIGTSTAHPGWTTALVGAAYLLVWTAFGVIAFAVGATLASLEMRLPTLARIVPFAIGAIALIAGALQFTTWKMHRLACCRQTPSCCAALPGDAFTALRIGMRLGVDCVHCCFGLTLTLLAIGMMDLRAMAVVTAAISAERLAPNGGRTARFIGFILAAVGLFLIVRAAVA